MPAVGNLISSANGIRYNTHSLNVLYSDLKELEKTKVEESRQLDTINKKSTTFSLGKLNQILLDRISYQYPNSQKNALEEVSLEIKQGESIGIIGKSGSGKTTLVDVILGLLTPQGGDIKADGVSVYNNLRSWQNMLGYVPQSIFLIDDTLERNIAFGVVDHEIDRDRLDRAIHASQLAEFVNELPLGLQTVVGERGVLLSGGQRQRIGIARALYYEREVLVFDEATAALDNDTESLVTEAIQSLSGQKTMIIIAHRLSTIERCDRIYMMQAGRIVKSGSYQEVVLNQHQS
jgi:ATP-binding cassette, subfamily B, bacterial PglK